MDEKVTIAIELLTDSKSKKRESGAKRLRKIASEEAGPYLLSALEKEIKDVRTWSCQFHMILALGFSKYEEALPFFLKLAGNEFEATVLYRAIGDAVFRLSIISNSIRDSLETIYSFENFKIMDGAFTALAMLRLVPEDDDIKRIIELARDTRAAQEVKGHPDDITGIRKWVATASAGWKDELKMDFLHECISFQDQHVTIAAEGAINGKYEKWLPY